MAGDRAGDGLTPTEPQSASPRARIVILVADQSIPGCWSRCARAGIDLRPARCPNRGGAPGSSGPPLVRRLLQLIRSPSTSLSQAAASRDGVPGTADLLRAETTFLRLP